MSCVKRVPLFTSGEGKEVIFHFVCLFLGALEDYAKTIQLVFLKFGGKMMAHETPKNPLDYVASPDHVTLG